MDDKQSESSKQYSANFGVREFLRFGCVYMGWIITGLALGIIFNNGGILMIFVAIGFGFLWFAPYWQPAYNLAQKIMGNKNIPSKLPKAQYKWWEYIIHYLILGIKLYLLLAVFF